MLENKNEIQIYIDADACPVKEETYKVASRYKIKTYVVANSYMRIPLDPLVEMKVVSGTFDAADDWIVENVTARDIVITADILLAERCVKKKRREYLARKVRSLLMIISALQSLAVSLCKTSDIWATCEAARLRWIKKPAHSSWEN